MPHPFLHEATLSPEPGADPAAPGGAVTLALCGGWDHNGPCRWPHETAVRQEGTHWHVSVGFTCAVAEEAEVRGKIAAALRGGRCVGPDGRESRWSVLESYEAKNPA